MVPHNGDWLFVLPVSSFGLCISNDAARVAVGLHSLVQICEAYTCSHGQLADVHGTHRFYCNTAAERSARHHNLNDAVAQVLTKAGVPIQKQPLGFVCTDGKRPDGVTLAAWYTFNMGCDRSQLRRIVEYLNVSQLVQQK
jgi:hypothetical protein